MTVTTTDLERQIRGHLRALSQVRLKFDARMEATNDKAVRELEQKLKALGASDDDVAYLAAKFRCDIEAKTAQIRNELRREAFPLINVGNR